MEGLRSWKGHTRWGWLQQPGMLKVLSLYPSLLPVSLSSFLPLSILPSLLPLFIPPSSLSPYSIPSPFPHSSLHPLSILSHSLLPLSILPSSFLLPPSSLSLSTLSPQEAFTEFQELEDRITYVATKVVHLGDQLESLNNRRMRAIEAVELMNYLDEFKDRSRPNLPVFTDPGRVSFASCLQQHWPM